MRKDLSSCSWKYLWHACNWLKLLLQTILPKAFCSQTIIFDLSQTGFFSTWKNPSYWGLKKEKTLGYAVFTVDRHLPKTCTAKYLFENFFCSQTVTFDLFQTGFSKNKKNRVFWVLTKENLNLCSRKYFFTVGKHLPKICNAKYVFLNFSCPNCDLRSFSTRQ